MYYFYFKYRSFTNPTKDLGGILVKADSLNEAWDEVGRQLELNNIQSVIVLEPILIK